MEKRTFVSKLSMVASLLCGSQNKTVGGQGEADSLYVYGARGPFLESPGNFSGPKSNTQIEI